jgi:hypothetical protein
VPRHAGALTSRPRHDLNGFLIIDVGPSSLDQAVDFGITDQSGQAGSYLGEGSCRLSGNGTAHAQELHIAESIFTVIRKSVTFDFGERHDLVKLVNYDNRFDDALNEHILRQLSRFGKGYGGHLRTPKLT